MGFEPRPPDCSGCKVSGLQNGATTPSSKSSRKLHRIVSKPGLKSLDFEKLWTWTLDLDFGLSTKNYVFLTHKSQNMYFYRSKVDPSQLQELWAISIVFYMHQQQLSKKRLVIG